MDKSVRASLEAAVEASPGGVPLRLHLAEFLLEAGQTEDAIRPAATALTADPQSVKERENMERAMERGPVPRASTGAEW